MNFICLTSTVRALPDGAVMSSCGQWRLLL